jgi:hypothetical protein
MLVGESFPEHDMLVILHDAAARFFAFVGRQLGALHPQKVAERAKVSNARRKRAKAL